MEKIFKDNEELLGFIGEKYSKNCCLVMMGSSARKEMCPDSDLECFVIFQKNSDVLQRFLYLFDFKIRYFGGTNDAKPGIRLDTSANPRTHDLLKNGVKGLLKTYINLDNLTSEEALSYAMLFPRYIWGEKQLFDDFQTQVKNELRKDVHEKELENLVNIGRITPHLFEVCKNRPLRQVIALIKMHSHYRFFETQYPMLQTNNQWDLKNYFMRPLQYLCLDIAVYNMEYHEELTEKDELNILGILQACTEQEHDLNNNNAMKAFAIQKEFVMALIQAWQFIMQLRINQHLENHYQREDYDAKTADAETTLYLKFIVDWLLFPLYETLPTWLKTKNLAVLHPLEETCKEHTLLLTISAHFSAWAMVIAQNKVSAELFLPIYKLLALEERHKFLEELKTALKKQFRKDQQNSNELDLETSVFYDERWRLFARIQDDTLGHRPIEKAGHELLWQHIKEIMSDNAENSNNNDISCEVIERVDQKHRTQKLFLLPVIAKVLFDEMGNIYYPDENSPQEKRWPGDVFTYYYKGINRHQVIRLRYHGVDIHIKISPNHPAMDYAIHTLRLRLFGHGSPPNTFATITLSHRKKTYFVLISLTAGDQNLKEALEKEDKVIEQLSLKALQQLALFEMLTHPGDSGSKNYTYRSQQKAIECVDGDQYGVESLARLDNNGNNVKGAKEIKEGSILYCLPKPMKTPLLEEILQELVELTSYSLLQTWLDDVMACEAENIALCKNDIENLLTSDKENMSTPYFLIRAGCTAQLAADLLYIQAQAQVALQTQSYPRLLQWWKNLNTRLANYFEKILEETDLRKRLVLAQQFISVSMTSRQSLLATLGEIPTQSEIQKQVKFSPQQAKKELEILEKDFKDCTYVKYSKNRNQTNNVNEEVQLYAQLQPNFKRMHLPGNANIPDRYRQYKLLAVLTRFAYESLILSHCTILTSELLEGLVNRSNLYLTYLDLRKCPQITDRAIVYIAKYCQNLEKLFLHCNADLKQLTDWQWPSSLPLEFLKLKTLRITSCSKLTTIQLAAKNLEELEVKNCPVLVTISAGSKILQNVNLDECAQLNFAALMNLTTRPTTLHVLSLLNSSIKQADLLMQYPFLIAIDLTQLPPERLNILEKSLYQVYRQIGLINLEQRRFLQECALQTAKLALDLNEKIIERLMAALTEVNEEEKEIVLKSLGQVGQSHVTLVETALSKIVQNYSIPVRFRVAASKTLNQIGFKQVAVSVLMEIMVDRNVCSNIRVAVCRVLIDIDSNHGVFVKAALAEIVRNKSNDEATRLEACDVLSRIGFSPAIMIVSALVEILSNSDDYVREKAYKALCQIGSLAVSALVKIVRNRSTDENTRIEVCEVLGRIDSSSAVVVVSALMEIVTVRSNDDWIREKACKTLGRIGHSQAAVVVPILLDTVRDGDNDLAIRIKACEALGQIGSSQAGVLVPILLPIMQSKNYDLDLRLTVCKILTQIDYSHLVVAVEELSAIVENAYGDSRIKACRVLVEIDSSQVAVVITALVDLVKDKNNYKWVRTQACRFLIEVDSSRVAMVVSFLMEIATDKENDLDIRVKACEALGQIDPSKIANVLPFLVEIIRNRDIDKDTQAETYKILCQIGASQSAIVAPALVELVCDRNIDKDIRVYACQTLIKINSNSCFSQASLIISTFLTLTHENLIKTVAFEALGNFNLFDFIVINLTYSFNKRDKVTVSDKQRSKGSYNNNSSVALLSQHGFLAQYKSNNNNDSYIGREYITPFGGSPIAKSTHWRN